jgi:hypothetical protein
VPTVRLNIFLKYLKRDKYIPDSITKYPPLLQIVLFSRGFLFTEKDRKEDPPICSNSS